MRKALKTFTAASIIAASVAATPALFAATQSNNAKDTGQMGQMMQGNGQMDHGMGMMQNGKMMPMMNMMTEMNRMMNNCNKMMESAMNRHHGDKGGSKG